MWGCLKKAGTELTEATQEKVNSTDVLIYVNDADLKLCVCVLVYMSEDDNMHFICKTRTFWLVLTTSKVCLRVQTWS